jgi:predicted MFS family arabinose efflux permease
LFLMPVPTFVRVTLPLAAMNFTNQASRSVVAVVGPAMAVELGLSASGLGALAGVFFAAYALTQLPVGLAIDMWGARQVQSVLAVVAACGFLLCALSPDTFVLGAGRFITGIGIAGALIGIMKANSQWFRPDQLAQMTGAAVFFGASGGLMATVPVQLLLPLIGWRGAFLLLAGLACMVALWITFSVPRRAPGAAPPPRRSLAVEFAEFGRIFGHPEFIRFAPAIAVLSGLVFTYQGLWAGPWLRDVAGLGDLARAGMLLGFALGMMSGNLISGQLASMAQRRGIDAMLIPYGGMAAIALAQLALIWLPSELVASPWALQAVWFVFAFAGSCGPAAYALVALRFPPALTGRVATAVNFAMLGTVFVLQNGIGLVLDLWPRTAAGGWDPAGYAAAMLVTLGLEALTILWLVLARPRWRRG